VKKEVNKMDSSQTDSICCFCPYQSLTGLKFTKICYLIFPRIKIEHIMFNFRKFCKMCK